MNDGKIKDLINNALVIGITSHIRPDGDAIGAVLGAWLRWAPNGPGFAASPGSPC